MSIAVLVNFGSNAIVAFAFSPLKVLQNYSFSFFLFLLSFSRSNVLHLKYAC